MVETSRLTIIPLNHEQLALYVRAEGRLEELLQLADSGRTFSPQVKEMVTNFTLPKMKTATADNYLFYTFWIIVEKATKIIIAELGFKGEPNDKGEVEIGYGTMPGQRGKGFMTEAVGGIVDWAKTRPGINYVLAETDEANIASVRIVQKNNFSFFDKKEKMLWWKIAVKDSL